MKDTEWHFPAVLYYYKFVDENLWYDHSKGGFYPAPLLSAVRFFSFSQQELFIHSAFVLTDRDRDRDRVRDIFYLFRSLSSMEENSRKRILSHENCRN